MVEMGRARQAAERAAHGHAVEARAEARLGRNCRGTEAYLRVERRGCEGRDERRGAKEDRTLQHMLLRDRVYVGQR